MTNTQVIENWVRNPKTYNGNSLNVHARNGKIFSYGTCLAQVREDGKIVYNATKYSRTTSKHQSYLRYALHENHKNGVTICNVPMWQTTLAIGNALMGDLVE